MPIQKQPFGKTSDGTSIDLYTLSNVNGLKAAITNFGATLVSLEVPDRDGVLADITLGYDNLDGYVNDACYFGASIGRFGNRIGGATFNLNGTDYTLAANDGVHNLHGGVKGFNKVVWSAQEATAADGAALKLTYLSPDGEEGFPGNLNCTITYTLTDNNELRIDYWAETDKPTVINLTHHSYFNLAGQGVGDILGHQLTLNADRYTAIDSDLMPTGELAPVKGTALDFTTATAVGDRIDQVPGGYDHNFVINGEAGQLNHAATLHDPGSGRTMNISTTEPGIQFYSGNFLDGSVVGKAGKTYHKHYALCLETQHFPDSPNQPSFPTTTLNPGEQYSHTIVHTFTTT